MMRTGTSRLRYIAFTAACAVASGVVVATAVQQDNRSVYRFRTGVDLINVTATVTDIRGRFVPDLSKDDFLVYEDGELQTVTHFSSERVPVSLGIVLDTSGSMEGEKMAAARDALNRFLFDLLGEDDEVFLYRFSYQPQLVHDWTSDRRRLSSALGSIQPRGGTAMYDAVADAVLKAGRGRHRKKGVVVISDGNDTNSEIDVDELQQLIRETEVLVYAIGVDSRGPSGYGRTRRRPVPSSPPPISLPFPIPGGGGRGRSPVPPPTTAFPRGGRHTFGVDDRVDVSALRNLTDDSGGRTEIVRTTQDLDPATAGIADELSKQYYLGYQAPGHNDGRWHVIEVEVRNSRNRVRARRGYIATP